MRTVGRCVVLVGISVALRKFSFHIIIIKIGRDYESVVCHLKGDLSSEGA